MTDANAQDTQRDVSLEWLENALPRIMRRLMDSENLDMPLLQLPLAQMRLAQALYNEREYPGIRANGEAMGRLSERLRVRHNALTQAADRLINNGLAERLTDPSDRRIVRLRLTEKGGAWVRQRRERRREHLDTLWQTLSPHERQEFVGAVRLLETIGNKLEPQTTDTQPALHDLQTVEETLSRFSA